MCGFFHNKIDDRKELDCLRHELSKEFDNSIRLHELVAGYRKENIMLTRYIFDLETTYLGKQEPAQFPNFKYQYDQALPDQKEYGSKGGTNPKGFGSKE